MYYFRLFSLQFEDVENELKSFDQIEYLKSVMDIYTHIVETDWSWKI